MFSKPLFKATLKQNYIVFIIILAVLMLYLPIIIEMFDPSTQETLDEMFKVLPQGLVAALGFSKAGTTSLGFVASYFYGFLIFLLPMIYVIIVANRSIASHVDKGSMAYLLSTPNTRGKIARTQAGFLLISITLLIGIVTIVGILVSEMFFPNELDTIGFLLLNLNTLLLYFALTGIGFFASCLFDDTKNSLALGAGLPVAFLVVQMLSNTGESVEFLKYFTLFTLLDPDKIISGEGYVINFVILTVLAIILYASGLFVFKKRDLPL